VTLPSPAKINWNLRVLSRRPDGFHEIESFVSPVTLHDELTFTRSDEPGLSLRCDRSDVPLDGRNLIVRAAGLLAETAGVSCGAACELVKRIPIGSGLGGGSSNAATTLVALNELWGLRRSPAELAALAARIGSDVPFFLLGGSAIMRGRGEKLEPVAVDFRGHIALLLPGLPVSTAAVYAECAAGAPGGGPVEPVAGLDAAGWMERAFNQLEPAACRVCPPLGPLMSRAGELAGRAVRMSGSGSTLFTAFDSEPEAQAFGRRAGRELNIGTQVVQVKT
jgi:4-diphosphocytidyl-2-C-methyl-D-erythritol kinase